jgi:hypothetical protein
MVPVGRGAFEAKSLQTRLELAFAEPLQSLCRAFAELLKSFCRAFEELLKSFGGAFGEPLGAELPGDGPNAANGLRGIA